MAFPPRKPEAEKAKNLSPCSTSDSNKNEKQLFYNISIYLLLWQLEMYFLQDQYQKLFR